MIRTARTALLAAFALLLTAGAAPPTTPKTKESPSLDDQLMKRLRAEPLDDVDRELFGPGEKQPADRKTPPRTAGENLKKRLARELGQAAISEDEDPLLSIARQMRDVEGLIARSQSGEGTQRAQKQIVADLDKLIQQARKRCKQSSSPNAQSQATASRTKVEQPSAKPGSTPGKPASKPARESTAKPGTSEAKKPSVEQVRALIGKWGTLPERQRQQLLQLPMEEFLPKYEPMIIEYFKRLSEEQGKERR